MSIYDDILAELKITNGELQVIRVALDRLATKAHTATCDAPGCDRPPVMRNGIGRLACAQHAKDI